MNRRKFLTILGSAGVVSALGSAKVAEAGATHTFPYYDNSYGVLHDTTRCIGCRNCEEACNKINNLPKPERPFDDYSVMDKKRRTSADAWTVVNKYNVDGKTIFRKQQCFHCNDPACASACFAKCFQKLPDGTVAYDGSQCVGCRYCMVACPFYVPGFEYDEAFDPLVKKCTFCHDTRLQKGLLPACVEACPMDALTFGRRGDLIKLARKRIADNPGKYVDYVYGEWDAGGTAWMVLAPAPNAAAARPTANPVEAGHTFEKIGLDTHLGNRPMGEYTYGALGTVPMIIAFWPLLFGGAYAMTKRREAMHKAETDAIIKSAKEDVTTAMDAAVRTIEEKQGQQAADEARKAMVEALKAREASSHGDTHGEGK